MATNTVDVLLTGKTLPGADVGRAAAAFAQMGNITPEQARALITSGKSRLVKRGLAPEEAKQLARHFAALGIETVTRPVAAPPPPKPAPPKQAAAAGAGADVLRDLFGDEEPPAASARAAGGVVCPKCGHRQAGGTECESCGIIFRKQEERLAREARARVARTMPEIPEDAPAAGSGPVAPQPPRQAQGGSFCTNCGSAVAAQAVACPHCGFHPRRERNFCFNCGTPIDARQVMCVKCGVSLKGSTLDSLSSMAGGATKKAAEFIDRHRDTIDALSSGAGGATKKAAEFIDRHKDKVGVLSAKAGDRKKKTAGLLAVFGGFIGAHKFYHGKKAWGFGYAVWWLGWVILAIMLINAAMPPSLMDWNVVELAQLAERAKAVGNTKAVETIEQLAGMKFVGAMDNANDADVANLLQIGAPQLVEEIRKLDDELAANVVRRHSWMFVLAALTGLAGLVEGIRYLRMDQTQYDALYNNS